MLPQKLDKEATGAIEAVHGSYEKYIDKMAKEGEWGDGVILSFASKLYGCPIVIHGKDNSTFAIGENFDVRVDDKASCLPIDLLQDGNHYSSLNVFDDLSNRNASSSFEKFDANDNDDSCEVSESICSQNSLLIPSVCTEEKFLKWQKSRG